MFSHGHLRPSADSLGMRGYEVMHRAAVSPCSPGPRSISVAQCRVKPLQMPPRFLLSQTATRAPNPCKSLGCRLEVALASHARGRWFEPSRAHSDLQDFPGFLAAAGFAQCSRGSAPGWRSDVRYTALPVTAPGLRRSGGSPAASAPRGPAPGPRGPRPRPRTGGSWPVTIVTPVSGSNVAPWRRHPRRTAGKGDVRGRTTMYIASRYRATILSGESTGGSR